VVNLNEQCFSGIIYFKTAQCIIATLPVTIYTFTETMATVTTKLSEELRIPEVSFNLHQCYFLDSMSPYYPYQAQQHYTSLQIPPPDIWSSCMHVTTRVHFLP